MASINYCRWNLDTSLYARNIFRQIKRQSPSWTIVLQRKTPNTIWTGYRDGSIAERSVYSFKETMLKKKISEKMSCIFVSSDTFQITLVFRMSVVSVGERTFSHKLTSTPMLMGITFYYWATNVYYLPKYYVYVL